MMKILPLAGRFGLCLLFACGLTSLAAQPISFQEMFPTGNFNSGTSPASSSIDIQNFTQQVAGFSLQAPVTGNTLNKMMTVITSDPSMFPAIAECADNLIDFEGVAAGTVRGCDNPVNSATPNPCFAPGVLPSGVSFETIGGGVFVQTGDGLTGPGSSDAFGPDLFASSMQIVFDPGIDAISFTLYDFFGSPSGLEVNVYNAGNMLLTSQVIVPGAGQFVGITTMEDIGRIEILDIGSSAQLIDDFTFCKQGPQAVCSDVSVQLDANGIYTVTDISQFVTATASLGLDSVYLSRTVFGCADDQDGMTEVFGIARDDAGNLDSCISIVTVMDTTPPVVDCPMDTILYATEAECFAVFEFDAPVGTDNCALETMSLMSDSPDDTDDEAFAFDIVVPADGEALQFNRLTVLTDVDESDPDDLSPQGTGLDPTAFRANVYVKAGTSVGFYSDESAWTLVSTEVFPSVNDTDTDSLVIELPSLVVNPGDTLAIYIANSISANDFTTFDFDSDTLQGVGFQLLNGREFDMDEDDEDFTSTSQNGPSFFAGILEYGKVMDDAIQMSGPASGEEFPLGETMLSFSLTDLAGNEGMCEYSVTVLDTIRPVIVCEAITVAIGADGTAMIENDDAVVSIDDNCDMDPSGPFTVGGPINGRTFDCSFVGTTVQRTVVATDMSGNRGECTYDVTIVDEIPPTLECPAELT
ncbi:hypothetical protein, partial [Neolewinella persica]|uniref:hypothetical protein n=1 Tax=Neolewinella persica TaxID=70998 RepID=UPI000477D943